MKPVLYSFRRCPYAIRARLAIRMSGIAVELREVVLRDKPESMLQNSPKGTVPVLRLPDGKVIDESYDIMLWALTINDPEEWLGKSDALSSEVQHLVEINDGAFKAALDRYKYADRYPESNVKCYREQGEVFLAELDGRLAGQAYLMGSRPTIADIAILPFIRQFAHVDKAWFDQSPYSNLKPWLEAFLTSTLFKSVMTKYSQWKPDTEEVVF